MSHLGIYRVFLTVFVTLFSMPKVLFQLILYIELPFRDMEDPENHHFKVVFISQLGEVEPVPHSWEKNGVLFWPSTQKQLRQYQSDASSKPQPHWDQYECVVKAEGIHLFSHATKTADRYCVETSTDDESTHTKSVSKRLLKKKNSDSQYDFLLGNKTKTLAKTKVSDEIPDTSINESINLVVEEPSEEVSNEISETEANENESFVFKNLDLPQIGDSTLKNNLSDIQLVSNKQFEDKFEELENKIDILTSLIRELKCQCNEKLLEINIKIDRLDEMISKNNWSMTNVKDDSEWQMFPIGTVTDLTKFEENMQDKDFKIKVYGHLSKIVGSGIPWKTACYKVCSTLFTKNLLTKYSWTGMSRSNEKHAFNKLTNLLDIFYKIVSIADSSFSYAQRDAFFRDAVLKHSNTRLLGPRKKTKEAKLTDGHKQDKSQDEESSEAVDDVPEEKEHRLAILDFSLNTRKLKNEPPLFSSR